MTIAVFLDTNIFMSDFKMEGQKFNDLFTTHEKLNTEEQFKLLITEMNLYEVIDNYSKKLKKAFETYGMFQKELGKIVDLDPKNTDYEDGISTLSASYKTNIEWLFYTVTPSLECYKKVFDRYYSKKMPFRENKLEFKDALIWETVYDYAIKCPEELIYFVSTNHNDFAVTDDQGIRRFHEDFDDLYGRIKYLNNLNELLVELRYLSVHHFDFQEADEILANVSTYISNEKETDSAIISSLDSFYSDHHFTEDFYEGWGTDYCLKDIGDIEINLDKEVLESEDYFYIPISFIGTVEYAVEMRNPVYEPGDEEFIQSNTTEDDLNFNCTAIYNIKEKSVEYLEDVEVDFS
ncbi:PIN domain-containing protein [Sporosarcina luteola]|uniref:PIN domain-containing protein n=1 Tax=Sporosarcina luteola TaxID=582850 RepID=UPI00204124D5|nr:PIN domain-containing protein [Sporosarcina luteola]MCM3743242.1 PIN domain-containing protein [Sporosarcina luteola]